jgi:hypothetical protein
MPSEDVLELQSLAKKLLKSFRGAPLRESLFRYLWEHHHKRVKGIDIWVNAWRHPHDTYLGLQSGKDGKTKSKPKAGSSQSSENSPVVASDSRYIRHLRPHQNVAQQCSALGKVLKDYFVETRSGWVIEMLTGGPARGYQLQPRKVNDLESLTWLFWKSHLDSPRDISVVYIEQLFYLDAAEGLVFRYYDCNAEHSDLALAELKVRHEKSHKNGLLALHPYVARGEVEARDSLIRWFAEAAVREVRPVVTRTQPQEDPTWQNSLILFGSSPANRFITQVLQRYPDLPIQVHPGGQVTVQDVKQEGSKQAERTYLEHMRPRLYYQLRTKDDGFTLDFDTGKGVVPAVLTRVPNPCAPDAPVTIIGSDAGRAIEQKVQALLDEQLLQKGMDFFGLKPPFPTSFQCLCAVSIKLDLGYHIYPLLWRDYSPSGL